MHKFLRTPHIRGSRFQHGDHDLEAVPWEELVGKHLVVEEKCDGSNCGISFSDKGELQLQSRGHYLHGGPREKQFELLKQWSSTKQTELRDVLGVRYVMYAEWLYAKHTIFYDALPHYFMEFDVFDTQDMTFLDTERRHHMLSGLNLFHAKVLAAGHFAHLSELKTLIKLSNFITARRLVHLGEAASAAGVDTPDALSHTDLVPEMEGLYVKWEEGGIVRGRYKFVRSSFTNAILDQETHWHDRPIIQNRLVDGALDKMFM
jgi:hypothetical protein